MSSFVFIVTHFDYFRCFSPILSFTPNIFLLDFVLLSHHRIELTKLSTADSHLNRYYLDDERSVKFLSSLSFISSLTQIYVALAFLIAVRYKLLTLFVPY